MAAAGDDKVKLIVSYRGEIRRCPVSGAARYVGGENRLVKVGMSERLCDLRARLAALAGYERGVRLRYIEDGLDAPLRDVDGDGDLWRLVTLLYFRSAAGERCRVRAFLFPVADDRSGSSSSPPAACLRQSASSPALASPAANNMGRRGAAAATSLLRAQSAGPLHIAGSSPATTTSGEAMTPIERADSGFEALAAIAEEQSRPPSSSANNNTGRSVTSPSLLRTHSAGPLHVAAGSSSATTTASGEATTHLERADSGFEALAAIAAEQSRPPSSSATSSSGGSAGAGYGGSGLETAVVPEHKLPPARVYPAPVVLVPVIAPVVAVFYPVIPVYQCVVLAGVPRV